MNTRHTPARRARPLLLCCTLSWPRSTVQGPDLPQVDREGVLTVDGEAHEVVLQDLPTVVEAYKSLDDTNLVKIADVGQVRVRGLWVRREH